MKAGVLCGIAQPTPLMQPNLVLPKLCPAHVDHPWSAFLGAARGGGAADVGAAALAKLRDGLAAGAAAGAAAAGLATAPPAGLSVVCVALSALMSVKTLSS